MWRWEASRTVVIGLSVLLFVLCCLSPIAYLVTSSSQDAIQLRDTTYDSAERVIDELIGIVRDNVEQ